MSFKIQKKKLYCPNKGDLCKVLKLGLIRSFKNVSVDLVDCPDLTESPFKLSSKGLCGNPSIASIGAVPYLMPSPNHDKIYKLKELAHQISYNKCHLVGAGAAPSHIIGNNAEFIVDVLFDKDHIINNNSHIAQINKQTDFYEVKKFSSCCDGKHLLDIYASTGDSGKVIEIKVSDRTCQEGFIECLQKILFENYKNECIDTCVGLGGVFVFENGSAKIHVMPDYSAEPLINLEMIHSWLRYFTMDAPLVCLGMLVSHDPGLKLRTEHFHCFNDEIAGGHFHYDVTPAQASYRAIFNVPEFLYRIDMPE